MSSQVAQKEKILSFRSDGLLYYETPVDHRSNLMKSSLFQNNASKLSKRKRYVGFVTDGIRKRMKKAITLLLQSTPWTYKQHPVSGRIVSHKISFITLTTPKHNNSLDAAFCHKNLLEPMLRVLRSKYGMKSYIWKCELQANKQVHYHITTDIMINHTHLRDEWNNILRRHDMLIAFKEKYGHDSPNSTDIHAVHKVKNLEAYLVKYICKEYQNEDSLSGKVWDCSKNLKQADYFKLHIDSKIEDFINELQNTLQVQTFFFEKAIFIKFFTSDYYSYFSENIINQFNIHLNNIRSWVNNKKHSIVKESKQTVKELQQLQKTFSTSIRQYVQYQIDYYPVGCVNYT